MTAAASPPSTGAPPTTSALALAERFARFISGLRVAMVAGAGRNPVLLNLAARLWNRLTEAAERFAAIAAHPLARFRRRAPEQAPLPAAPLPADALPAAPLPAAPAPADAPPTRPAPPRRILPTTYGWLARMAPETVPSGIEFAHLLALPEMTALLTTAPRLWRVLRPFCRMFAITPHDAPPRPPPAPGAALRRAAQAARNPARLRRRSEAAAIREHGPQGYRPSFLNR